MYKQISLTFGQYFGDFAAVPENSEFTGGASALALSAAANGALNPPLLEANVTTGIFGTPMRLLFAEIRLTTAMCQPC